MKYKLILGVALIIAAAFSCKTQHIPDDSLCISKENRVVLPNEEYFKQRYELWAPTENDIQEALDVIYVFLRNAQADKGMSRYFRAEIKKIFDNIRRYRVQFVGIMLNNRRYIHCNFIHENSRISGWKQRLIMVAAGGFWYWYVYYDAELKKVVKIYINGCT